MLNSLISSSNFLIVSLGFSIHYHVICKQREFCFFFSDLDSFHFFSSLIAKARTSKTMLSISGESEHPCLVPDLRGNAISFSPLRVMFAVVLSNQGYGFSSGHVWM